MDLLNNKSSDKNDRIKAEILDILGGMNILPDNMKIAEQFFDFSKELNLELAEDAEFQNLKNVNFEVQNKSRRFLLALLNEEKTSEYINRYILFLDAVGKDTIYNLLTENFTDEYLNNDNFCTQISNAFSNIHNSYNTIFSCNLSSIGKISSLIASSSDSLYFEQILINTAKSYPTALLIGGCFCNDSNIMSKLKLFGLGLSNSVPASKIPTQYDMIKIDAVKYIIETLNIVELKNKKIFSFIMSICFMTVNHSEKIENYIKDTTLGKKLDFFTAIISIVPDNYFEKNISKFIELSCVEQSETFISDCINIAIAYVWTENGYKSELFLDYAAVKYPKQFTEAMYSTEKAKSITQNIDKTDFCSYYITENIHKKGKIKDILWLYKTPNSTVRFNNGSEANDRYMQAIMLCYSGMVISFRKDERADFLAKHLKQNELNKFAVEIFSKWIQQGAKANQKWVLYFSAIYGGVAVIDIFLNYIEQWEKSSRGAIAAEAVKALAFNKSIEAFKSIKNIAHRSEHKQVKSVAQQVLNKYLDEQEN